MHDDILVVIPARAGSKGIPHKNSKELGGKPLISYSIDIARHITSDEHICVSTDDPRILEIANEMRLPVPFVRPTELAGDDATTNDVLLHALNHYLLTGTDYKKILLLQPTSPFRTVVQVEEAIELFTHDIDMVVSVKKSHAASVICHEDTSGYLSLSLNSGARRRQDLPQFYEYNGAIYVINSTSLRNKGMSNFNKKVKYVMDEVSSLDIDSALDWNVAEYLIEHHHVF